MRKRVFGFTLVEIAIILVVLGFLIGLGAALIGPLTKRMKINETRETLDAIAEAIISYAAGNKCLRGNLTAMGVRKTKDAWNKDILYIRANVLLYGTGNCIPYTQDICGRKGTSLKLKICKNANCTVYDGNYTNIAFVVVSGGPNYNIQIFYNATEVRIYAPGTPNVDDYNDPPVGIRPEEFDDLVKWVTLNELRVKMGCPGAQLRIITSELPVAYQGSYYTASILAEGGWSNITWTVSGLPNGLSGGPQNDTRIYTINGTPQCYGTYSIKVDANDTNRNFANKTLSFVVQPNRLYLSPMPGTTFYAQSGTWFSRTITASGGYPPYNAICIPPTSCNGLTCSGGSSITISGNPNPPGTCTFNVTFSDSCNGSSKQTINATYTVEISGGSGSSASCSISPNPAYVNPGSNVILNVTISNGPTNASFSPTTGICTTFNNTNGFSCTSATFNTNTPNLSLTLNLSSGNSCNTEICVNRPFYRVWNLTGSRRDFRLPDGTCRTVNNNSEITTPTSRLTPGTQITAYNSNNGSCSGGVFGYFDYSWVRCIDDNGDGLLNFNIDGTVSDR